MEDCNAFSEDSDQQADWSFRCLPEDTLDPWLPIECPAKIYQSEQMRRLIRYFAGRACNLVRNAVPRLIYACITGPSCSNHR